MITITIKKTVTREVEVNRNFIVSESVDALESHYSSPKTKKEYETRLVKEERTETKTLLEQEISDEHEATFDLNEVICAINQIKAC